MFVSPWITDGQMNAPHPGTNFPAAYPQYPPAAFQGKKKFQGIKPG